MTSITFRTSGAWGAGAGANLTPAQVDTNFYNLKLAVESLQDNPPEAVSVDSVVQTGNVITFYMTDGTTQGPFTLPAAAITFRGAWAATTGYGVGDIIEANGGLYIVLSAHTSAATFDPGANDGSGADYYDLILSPPVPAGGTTGQVLTKLSGTDYDVGWLDAATGSSGAIAFSGATVKNMLSVSVTADEFTPTFSTEVFDTNSFHSTSINSERLTIPAGVTYVRVGANIFADGIPGTSYLYAEIQKNEYFVDGSPFAQSVGSANNKIGLSISSGPIAVTEGDYFTLYLYCSEPTVAYTIISSTSFWIEVVA